jgi:hypothetical protein
LPPLAFAGDSCPIEKLASHIDVVLPAPDLAHRAGRARQALLSVEPDVVTASVLETVTHVGIQVRSDALAVNLDAVPGLQRRQVGEDETEIKRQERIVQIKPGVATSVRRFGIL